MPVVKGAGLYLEFFLKSLLKQISINFIRYIRRKKTPQKKKTKNDEKIDNVRAKFQNRAQSVFHKLRAQIFFLYLLKMFSS